MNIVVLCVPLPFWICNQVQTITFKGNWNTEKRKQIDNNDNNNDKQILENKLNLQYMTNYFSYKLKFLLVKILKILSTKYAIFQTPNTAVYSIFTNLKANNIKHIKFI